MIRSRYNISSCSFTLEANIDVYQRVTDTIVAAIEKGADDFVMPWQRGGSSRLPTNVESTKHYAGINVLSLWCCAEAAGYSSNTWGTYKQWQALGAQVRKGEKAAPVIFYSELIKENEEGEDTKYRIIRSYNVFNAAQVDGYTEPSADTYGDPIERLAHVEAFVAGTKVTVIEGGDRAFYRSATDQVHMPDSQRFRDTQTASRTEHFYSVLSHELVHATGHKSRLDRDFSSRFGDEAYAAEELVAELGAAYLCAYLEISPCVREDHACYLASWLKVLKGDKKAIFAAAAKAQQAVEYLKS